MFPYRKVVFQKVDLDTVLTALIEGVRPDVAEVVAVQGSASAEDRNDPSVLCIECTGNGDMVLNNRDHHAGADSRPACVQAFSAIERWLNKLRPLVNYVAEVDTGKKSCHRLSGGPSLVWLYSGIMITHERNKVDAFWATLRLLHKVLELNIDPYGNMNLILENMEEAKTWNQAKREHEKWSKQVLTQVKYSESEQKVLIAYVESTWIGAVGLVKATETKGGRRPDVVICLNPDFKKDGTNFHKYSIATSATDLSKLATFLNSKPEIVGWGGPVRENPKKDGAFLGSPTSLSMNGLISLEEVVNAVSNNITSDCVGVTEVSKVSKVA